MLCLRISNSTLNALRECPRKGVFSVERRPAENLVEIFEKGKRLHRIMEEYLKTRDRKVLTTLENPEKTAEILDNLVKDAEEIEVEKRFEIRINEFMFEGTPDLVIKKFGEVIIVDHKSYALFEEKYQKQLSRYSLPYITNGFDKAQLKIHLIEQNKVEDIGEITKNDTEKIITDLEAEIKECWKIYTEAKEYEERHRILPTSGIGCVTCSWVISCQLRKNVAVPSTVEDAQQILREISKLEEKKKILTSMLKNFVENTGTPISAGEKLATFVVVQYLNYKKINQELKKKNEKELKEMIEKRELVIGDKLKEKFREKEEFISREVRQFKILNKK